MKLKVIDYDVIYLSYDEPNAEKNYADLLSKVPWAKRVHGVEGSDAAHKACANLSETDRFITIDGDNIVHQNFINEELHFKDDVDIDNCVISWSGYNIVNGLTYGNGGIKCWPKNVVLDMKTHENAESSNPQSQVDFCWDLQYLQVNKTYSSVYNNATPWQAWRAGFREGVKMSLYEGEKLAGTDFTKRVHKKNFERLKIWQTVGCDSDNGLWAIYGAREGCYLTNCTDWDFVNVRDFEYLNKMWKDKYSKITKEMLPYEIIGLGETLNHELNIDIPVDPYTPAHSKFFKSMYVPPVRVVQDFLKTETDATQEYDIVMITYDEPHAEENYSALKEKFPRAKRIHGVKGIHQAHIEAAKLCATEMIWIVDGDAQIADDFNFDYISPENEKEYVKVWRSKNPINDLEYGYGGIKLFPRTLTINMDTSKADMTTSISRHFKPIKVVSNITAFNTDPFSTWRGAFRECCKLSSKVIDRQKNEETENRLHVWQTVGESRPYGEYAIRGAKEGAGYGNANIGNTEALKKINDFDWLKQQFETQEPVDSVIVQESKIEIKSNDDIVDLLDRFELLYQGDISNVRRVYNDKDLSSIFKLIDNEELRKAVIEQNLHSIFRILNTDDDFRKAVIEQNLHSIFRIAGADDDLRKAVIERNLHSIFRLLPEEHEDLRRAVTEHNLHSLARIMPELSDTFKIVNNNDISALWNVLDYHTNSLFIKPLKTLYNSNLTFDKDCFSRGQLQSKIWLTNKLKELNIELGIVYLCAGWYSTIVPMFVENNIKFSAIRSFDIDPDVWKIAELFNKPLLLDGWKFKAQTKDIMEIDYARHIYNTIKGNGDIEEVKESPDTIINTSCEHIPNFTEWYAKIPSGKLVILQSNNFFEVDEHVNCSIDINDFSNQTPLSSVLYSDSLELEKYTRYMRIGIK
tara:strand:+ start:2380 stop:5130 length:2751 start_codon:yes stop_codon:yes gene_type:complete